VDILRFYDKYVAPNAPLRQKLCVHVVAKQYEEDAKHKKDDDSENEEKIAAPIVSSSSEGGEEEEQAATKEGTAMDVVDDDDNNNQEKQDSAKTKNESLSFLSTTKVIRIEDPMEFRRTMMPLYPMPPNAPVTVVEVGVSRKKKSDRIYDTTNSPGAKKYNPTR